MNIIYIVNVKNLQSMYKAPGTSFLFLHPRNPDSIILQYLYTNTKPFSAFIIHFCISLWDISSSLSHYHIIHIKTSYRILLLLFSLSRFTAHYFTHTYIYPLLPKIRFSQHLMLQAFICTYRWWYSASTAKTLSVCFLSLSHVACSVCLWTGCPGLQGADAPQHHQMVSNSHGMFRPFKTMTPYCWWAHSEVDVFLTVCCGISTPWYLEVAISSMKPSLLSLHVSWLLFSGLHHRSR